MIYVDGLEQWGQIVGYHGDQADHAARVGARHGHQWCHLFADEADSVELHRFARALGLKRGWFQGNHYDIVPTKRARAVAMGAIELNRAQSVAVWRTQREGRKVNLEDLKVCGTCKGPVSPTTGKCTRCGRDFIGDEFPPFPGGPNFDDDDFPALPSLDLAPITTATGRLKSGQLANAPKSVITLPPIAVASLASRDPAPKASTIVTLRDILDDNWPKLALPPMHTGIDAIGHPQETPYPGFEPARVLVADPPWAFGDKLPGGGRGAEKHYKTLSIDEIKAFPLPPLAANAVLFLWRVEALGRLCYEVAEAWGFTPKSKITWRKTNKCKECEGRGYEEEDGDGDKVIKVWCEECEGRGEKLLMGMGRYTRRATEDCIIAVRASGKLSAIHPKTHSTPDVYDTPETFDEARTFHSAKPERFFDIVEELYPEGPYTELFARRRREGWQCFGDELAVAK